jgi:hypothetical protein
MQVTAPLTDTSIQPVDKTLDADWLDEQVCRLSGYQILRRILRGIPIPYQPSEIHELCGVGKKEPHNIHKEKLVKGIMKRLNVKNTEEASLTLSKILDERR